MINVAQQDPARLTHTAPHRPGSARNRLGLLPRAQLRSYFRVSPRYRCARRRTGGKIARGTARDVVSSLVADEAAGQPDAGSRNLRGR